MNKLVLSIAVVLVLAAAWRIVMLGGVPTPIARDQSIAAARDAADGFVHLRIAGAIVSVQPQVFDSLAEVILAPGNDGKPGQKGFDDNFDGVVDNSSELGAMKSDDFCVAPWNPFYQDLIDGGYVITRGTFVPIDSFANLESGIDDTQHERRLLIVGETDGIRWSRVVDIH